MYRTLFCGSAYQDGGRRKKFRMFLTALDAGDTMQTQSKGALDISG